MAKGGPDTSVVLIPLSTGVNESVAERLAPVGVLRSVSNCRIRDGQLVKRQGSTQSAANDGGLMVAGGSGAICGYPSFVSNVGRASVMGNTEGIMSAYNPTQDFFYFQGLFSNSKPVRQRYGFVNTTPTTGATANSIGECPPSTAVDADGNVCTTVCDNAAGIMYCYIENPQGDRIWYTAQFGTYNRSQVTALNSGFYVVYQQGSDIRMFNAVVMGAAQGGANLGVPAVTVGTSSSVGTMVSGDSYWDTSANSNTSDLYLVYQTSTTNIRVKGIVGPASAANITVASGSKAPVSVYAEFTYTWNVWVGWYEDPAGVGELRYAVYSRNLLTPVLANTLIHAAGSSEYGPPMFGLYRQLGAGKPVPDGLTCFMVVRRVTSGGLYAVGTRTLTTGGFGVGVPSPYYGAVPLGKPDQNMRAWCMVSSSSSNQLENRVALLGFRDEGAFTDVVLSGPNFVAIPQAISPAEHASHKWHWLCGPAHFAFNTTSSWFFSFPEVLTTVEGVGTDATLMKISTYEYQTGAEDYHQVALPLGVTTVVGGQPTEFWGQPAGQLDTNQLTFRTAAECGFIHSPTILSLTTTAATGPGAGTYSYRAIYEWTDAYGRRHRSAPSADVSVTLTTGNQLPNLIVTACQYTQRVFAAAAFFPSIVLYRTLNGGEDHHRTSAVGVPATTTTPAVTITDSNADADIDTNEPLYTDGNVLDYTLAPSCRFMARSEDRVWAGGLWDPTLIQCSRVIVPGEPLQWAEDGSHQIVLGDECTGIAYMDGAVIAFTRNDIRLITGDGPNDQGIGSFPSPRIHTSGIGCSNYRSILETSAGVFFQYGRALYLIPKGFGPVVNISGNIRQQLENWPAILSASYLDGGYVVRQTSPTGAGRQSLARFLVAQSMTSASAEILTLDLTSMQWLTDAKAGYYEIGVWSIPLSTLTNDAASSDLKTFALAKLLDRTVNASPVEYESLSASEGSTISTGFIAQSITTGWISPFGLVGWGRVRKAVVYFERDPSDSGACTTLLQMQVVTLGDGGQTTQTASFNVDQSLTVGQGVEFREVQIDKDVCSSLQVTLSDAYNVSDTRGRGFRFMALALEVEQLSALRPQNSASEKS